MDWPARSRALVSLLVTGPAKQRRTVYEVTMAPGEEVLWTGAPTGIAWWFGGRDVYLTAFGLVWLAWVTGMAGLVAQSGNSAFFWFGWG